MTPTYVLSYACPNCSVPTPMTFPRGKPAPDTVECGNCGCVARKVAVWEKSENEWERLKRFNLPPKI